MSERKVLNKYYPPDYDPSLIPRLKRAKDRQYVIRVMAPFNMRCKTCGNYIYKGTKFNARMETVQDKNYLGLRIYRFYIKCTRCVAEITFMTDPENQDYSLEHGATRNFEAEKILAQQEKKLQAQKEEDEANPMKMLEIRTRDSKREMEMVEALEELRELNERHVAIDYEGMLRERQESEEERQAREKKEEDMEIRAIFSSDAIRRLQDDSDEDDPPKHLTTSSNELKRSRPTEHLVNEVADSAPSSSSSIPAKSQKIGTKSTKLTASLLGVVRKKPTVVQKSSQSASCSSTERSSDSSSTSQKQSEHSNASTNGGASSSSSSTNSSDKPSSSTSTTSKGGLSLLGGYGSGSSSEDSD